MTIAEKPAAWAAPGREELLKRAALLAPAIASRQDEADRIRDIPAQTISELADAGLLRVFQPARWGGYECDPRTVYAIQNVIAEVCPSTAWVYGVLNVQSLLLGRLDERLQADVWGEDDGALVCSSFAPVGKAEPVEGGFRLRGRWSFSSGSSFANWALVGGQIAGPPPAGPPVMTLFLIPRRDYDIQDVWNTFGLRGTGSNDLVASDIFVPSHRCVRMDPGLQNTTRAAQPGSPLYRMPWLYVFSGMISNFAIGAGRGALGAFIEVARTRVSPMTGKASKDDPAVAEAIARLAAEIERAQAMYDHHIARQSDYVARDEMIPLPEALLYRAQLTSELRQITALVDDLMLLQGSRATDMGSRVTRIWLDLCAARAHMGNDPTKAYNLLGSMLCSAPAG